MNMRTSKIEEQYIERLKHKDAAAFSYIYTYYRDSIYFFVLTILRNEADAEEVVQDSFVKVYRHIHTLKKNDAFHSWLFMIAYNTATVAYRKKQKEFVKDDESYLEDIVVAKENPIEEYNHHEIVEQVRIEIEKLPLIFIQTAYLRYFHELTVKEISKILDIPEGTVKNRLNRVRQDIKPALIEKGIKPSNYFSLAFAPTIPYYLSLYAQDNF